MERIPKVFNNVEDEFELREFCTQLLDLVVELTRAAGEDRGVMARRIIDIHPDDSKEFCKLGAAVEVLVKAGLDEKARKRVLDRLSERAHEFDVYGKAGIKAIRARLKA